MTSLYFILIAALAVTLHALDFNQVPTLTSPSLGGVGKPIAQYQFIYFLV